MNSEEQYKNIEQKIIEASSRNEYPFTEDAWKRMELLLDKKERKLRFFFWLLPVLLLTVVGGLVIFNDSKTKTTSLQQHNLTSSNNIKDKTNITQIKPQQNEVANATNTNIEVGKIEGSVTNSQSKSNLQKAIPELKSSTNNSNINSQYQSKKITSQKTKKRKKINDSEDEFVGENTNNIKSKGKTKVKITTATLGEDEALETGDDDESKGVVNIKTSTPTIDVLDDKNDNKHQQITTLNKEDAKKDSTVTLEKELVKKETTKKTSTDKSKKKKSSNFYLLASLGAEVNTTQLLSFNNTTVVPRYGGSIGYQFNKKLSMQAGFYASGKKYVAQKKQYKFPSNSYYNYVDMKNIEANCLVYELPLSVQYNMIAKPQINIYASAGFSGFIMKKEDYIYNYSYGGTSYSTPSSYTKNTHLLATVNFAIGVEKQLNKKMVLQLSPRISIPLGGVGQGAVKLYSSGIDFGIKYFPFKK